MSKSNANNWNIYRGDGKARKLTQEQLLSAPSWRQFRDDVEGAAQQQKNKGENFQPPPVAIEMVNAALALRRPLLITGNPGTGKSSLAYAVARELGLKNVLKWAITTRTTLKDGLYSYDAIARLQDAQASGEDNRQETGNYITLGPLGTAFLPADLPRVLLIDEIDKSDIDLPNDLLNLFEDGEFSIPELQRLELAVAQVRTVDRENGKQRKINRIDAQSARMSSRQGTHPSYAMQTVVDDKNALIVQSDAVSDANDSNQLEKQISAAEDNLQRDCQIAGGDAGYANIEQIEKLESDKRMVLVPSQA